MNKTAAEIGISNNYKLCGVRTYTSARNAGKLKTAGGKIMYLKQWRLDREFKRRWKYVNGQWGNYTSLMKRPWLLEKQLITEEEELDNSRPV